MPTKAFTSVKINTLSTTYNKYTIVYFTIKPSITIYDSSAANFG